MLIKCPECQKEISGEANRCPHCGFANRSMMRAANARAVMQDIAKQPEGGGRNYVGILLLILAALVVIPVVLGVLF